MAYLIKPGFHKAAPGRPEEKDYAL